MTKTKHWRPIRPSIGEAFPEFEAQPFDPRVSTFIPDASVQDRHIVSVSPRKVHNIGIKVYRSTAQATADGIAESMSYDTVVFNQGFSDPGTSFEVVPVPYDGRYLITANFEYASNGTGRRTTSFRYNAVAAEGDSRGAVTGATTRGALVALRELTAGDEIDVRVFQTSTGALDMAAGEESNSLSIHYLGPV